jgi:hypothetical protein
MRKIYYGIQNLIRWTPIIWNDRDWDWIFLAKIMQYKLRRMNAAHITGHHVSSPRYARQTLICAELLKRLIDDEVYKISLEGFGKKYSREWFLRQENRRKLDSRYLGKILGKYLLHWWE